MPIEGNVIQDCTDATGNCHALILRNVTVPPSDTIIYRYNYMQNLDGPYYLSIGGRGDDVRNVHVYNNTLAGGAAADETWAVSGVGASFQNASGGVVKNNILAQRAGSVTQPPWYGAEVNDGNLVYTEGLSGDWPSPYNGEIDL